MRLLCVILFLFLLPTITVSAQLIPSAPITVPIIAAKNQSAKIQNQYIIAFQFGLNESAQASVFNLITNPITSGLGTGTGVGGTLGSLGLNVLPVGPLDAIVAGTILFNFTSAFFGFAAIIPDSLLPLVLQLTGAIEYMEEDATLRHFGSTTIQETDTSMWNLDRIDQRSGIENGYYMYSGNGTGVNVYVIDTGIRISHQEFQGRAKSGFNAVKDDKGTDDCQGHGTHVAGTVGGRTYGAAKGVQLYAVRVLACDGSGSTSAVMAGVDWVSKNRKDPAIGTMSLGGGLSSSLDTAVKNSIASGIVYTVAAGNNDGSACDISPANVATAITVGAIDRDDARASYSNWGTCVTLFAPGSSIRSASHSDDTSARDLSGTSMATPLVAGVVAIYIEMKKAQGLSYTPKSVKEDLICSSTKDVVIDPQNSPNRIIYNFFTSPASATSPPPSSISESCDNNSCETWTGTLSSQTIQFQPNGTSYKTTAGGYHRGWLDTTSGGSLLNPIQNNLILYQLKLDKWNVVASSSTRGGSQQVVYSASAGGDFAWGIQAKGATPTSYSLTIKRPTAAMTNAPSSSATTCTNNGNLNPDYDKNPGGPPKNQALRNIVHHGIIMGLLIVGTVMRCGGMHVCG